jgi:hypothetical protein
VFAEPVDEARHDAPGYYTRIAQPMDLSIIRNKLQHHPEQGQYRQYRSPCELDADMQTMFSNCMTFNPTTHFLHKQAKVMCSAWDSVWGRARVEEDWAVLKVSCTACCLQACCLLCLQSC